MLRAYVIDFGGSGMFTYPQNGRKCRLLVLWPEIGESRLIGPELVQETTDKVVLIKEKLKAASDRQKSYADNRRKPLEFEVRGQVLLKREAFNKSNLEIIGYQMGLESLEARIVVYEKNEAVYEEDIAFLKYDVQVKDISIKDLKN
ncbi:hypothetical protein Tco_1260951, partial [Tanacetum coccineum]